MRNPETVLREVSARLSLRDPLREALQTISAITARLSLKKVPEASEEAKAFLADELEQARSVRPQLRSFDRLFPSLTCSIATGVGKTRLMAATIYYLHQVHGLRHFFILAPNLTLYEKLLRDFGDTGYEKYVFRGLAEYVTHPPLIITGDNYLSSGTGSTFGANDDKQSIEINIFNISKFNSDNKGSKRRGAPSLAPRMKRISEYLGTSYYNYLSQLDDLVILMDEAHRYYADASRNALDELHPVLGLEMTATPLRGGKAVKNIIYEYNLAQALSDGKYVKVPAVARRRDFDPSGRSVEELENYKLEDGLSIHQHTKSELELYARNEGKPLVKPFVLVACRDINHAKEVEEKLQSSSFYGGRYAGRVLRIDSTNKNEDEIAQQFLEIESPDSPIEIVIHVNMLGEGWDVKNLYTIIPLRAANAVTLIEQTIGRGLRLPFGGERTGRKLLDQLTIIAHDNFERIVEAAKDEQGLLHKLSYIELDPEELDGEPVVIQSFAAKNAVIEDYERKLAEAETAAEKALIAQSREASTAILNVMGQVAERRGFASIERLAHNTEALDEVLQLATEQIEQSQDLFKSEQLALLTHSFATETMTRYKRNSIEIPRVSILPGKTHCYLERFEVDFSSGDFEQRPHSEDIVRQSLVDGEQEQLSVIKSGVKGLPLHQIIGVIWDYPDIDYDRMKEALVDVVNQVLDHLHEINTSEEAVTLAVEQYHQIIGMRLYNQISRHIRLEFEGYEEISVLPFRELYPVQLGERSSYPRQTLQAPLNSRWEIRRHLFHDFKKACHECYAFDSTTERDFALLLENDPAVLTWLRPSPLQFNITWGRDSRKYEPDFVVETTECIYLVETKAYKDLSSIEVQSKAEAASLYCERATEYTTTHGGKPWQYLLISHLDVRPTYSMEYLVELSRMNTPGTGGLFG